MVSPLKDHRNDAIKCSKLGSEITLLKWICDHRSESQFKELRNSRPKKRFSGFQRHSNPCESWESTAALTQRPRKPFFRPAISQLLKLRFTGMVTFIYIYSFHLYSHSSHHFILCSKFLSGRKAALKECKEETILATVNKQLHKCVPLYQKLFFRYSHWGQGIK